MFAEDMGIYFADFGLSAAWTPSGGGQQQTAKVLFDEPDEVVLGDQLVVSNVCEITYPAGQLAGLDEGESITVDGIAYRVRERPRQTDDGRIMKALISKN